MKVILVVILTSIYGLCLITTNDAFPRSALCTNSQDIFHNGNYIKTACFVHQSVNSDLARQRCAENNMNLFIMNNEIVASHLMDAAQERFPGIHGNLIVNGRRQSLSKRWQVLNADGTVRGSLSRNIQFYSNNEPGNCLRISGRYTGIYNPLPVECNSTFYFVCEHFQRSQHPPVLNTAESSNYDQARRRCAARGMNLFVFDSAEVNEAFFEAIEDITRSIAGGWWWINGRRNPQTNRWSVYHANRVLKGQLYGGFEFVRLNGTNGVTSGDCLRLSGQRGPFQGLGVGCETNAFVMCEYIRNN